MGLTLLARNAAADAIADLITAVSLHTADPGNNAANEVATNGYARGATTGTDWAEADGKTKNNAKIRCGTPTVTGGQVTHFAVHGAGGQLGSAALTNARNIEANKPLEFAAEALVLTIPAA